MKKGIVIITGVNIKEAKTIFKSTQKDLLKFNKKFYKVNASAGSAIKLNKEGYIVYLVSNSKESLDILSSFLRGEFYIEVLDLGDNLSLQKFINKVTNLKKEKNLPVHLVYYGSASETRLKLPENSIFLNPWDTPQEALGEIVIGNIVPWLSLIQGLRSIFNIQERTNLIVITAVAAIRALPLALIDNVQKGAVHSMARSLALDLSKEKIYLTEIMPGTTDTGFYDNEFTREQVVKQGKGFGWDYEKDNLPMFAGQKIGEAVSFVLNSEVHIREISMVAFGQIPHLGA